MFHFPETAQRRADSELNEGNSSRCEEPARMRILHHAQAGNPESVWVSAFLWLTVAPFKLWLEYPPVPGRSSSDNFVAASHDVAGRVARIDHKGGIINDPLVIEVGVVGRDYSHVLVP